MRHVVIDGPRSVTVAEAPDAVLPGADGVVVAVDATAICGSDMHFYDGDIPVGGAGLPVGHEFLGTVAEAGPGVTPVPARGPGAHRVRRRLRPL